MSRLRARVEYLEEKLVAFEREFLGDDLAFPVDWRLTRYEARIVGVLLCRTSATREQLLTAIYRFESDEPEGKIIDAHICKIRQKLLPFGVMIRTAHGHGYAIDDPKRSLLRAMFKWRAAS